LHGAHKTQIYYSAVVKTTEYYVGILTVTNRMEKYVYFLFIEGSFK